MTQPSSTIVKITDVDIPISSLVRLMLKWAVASIPAFIVLGIAGFICGLIFAGFGAGLTHLYGAR